LSNPVIGRIGFRADNNGVDRLGRQ
jgi:hypothetical protein